MTSSADAFKALMSRFATGIAVATTRNAEGAPLGVTINSLASVSLAPPLLLFCLDRGARTHASFMQATHFGINILSAFQQDISVRFAADPQAGWPLTPHRFHAQGTPILDDVLAWAHCAVHTRVEAGDHTIIIGRVEETGATPDGIPLLHFRSAYRQIKG